MSVLVDTSVWIDHFRRADARLQACLAAGEVWTHTVVIGELASGQLRARTEILRHLQKLPRADEIDLEEGLHLIDQQALAGRGLSWSDVQLLAAARIDGVRIWTRDKALIQAADELGLRYPDR
ncbi:MAG: type II toxin-antitoxin system VapC family toxin [Candidatus Didemnitutus sp.]|nr:type II toxin-antitoxin system VapC family toxin [Candidatus Didemnitutus sp.]